MTRLAIPASVLAMLCLSGTASAWDPVTGDWSKSDPTDLRVMTWNIQDGICRTNDKLNNAGDWNAIVRIVAAMQPDVLILQECGDNDGNGTGSGAGVDNVTQLGQVLEMFMHGGTDTFLGGSVTSYVQLFVPGYDLPYIHVSSNSDGFNRNVIMSRYPFQDLNGGGSNNADFILGADQYQGGGTGGIRGFMFAEINLPDETYAGNIVVGNAHLKSGGTASDAAERLEAAQNTAYFIDYYYNGAGTGVSDPNSRVFLPTTGTVLDENTPVVWGGDFNQQPGGSGPVEWMTRAQVTGGTDGTDRDRSDSTRDTATQPVSGETGTQGSNSKLDYLCWQDSIATARRSFIFRSSGSGMTSSNQPFPVSTFPSSVVTTSSFASDHRPVIVDFILPAAEVSCPAPPDYVDDETLNFFDVSAFLALYNSLDPAADLDGSGTLNFFDVSAFLALYGAGCP